MYHANGRGLESLDQPCLESHGIASVQRQVFQTDIDQAFQFCLSCGVLVPPQQTVTPELLQQELAKRLAGSPASAVRRPDPTSDISRNSDAGSHADRAGPATPAPESTQRPTEEPT